MKPVNPNNASENNGEAGFSLIELAFATGIMSVALALLFGSLISVSVVGEVALDQTEAAVCLSSAMEELRSMQYNELLSIEGIDMAHGPGIRRTVVVEIFDASGEPVELPAIAAGQSVPVYPNPLQVKATLIWEDESSRVHTRHVSTQVAR